MSQPFRCEICQGPFAPSDGGACSRCHRLCCGLHLHGWLGQFWKPLFGGPGLCRDCRRGGEQA